MGRPEENENNFTTCSNKLLNINRMWIISAKTIQGLFWSFIPQQFTKSL